MAITYQKPIDLMGRRVSGEDPLGIPYNTDAYNELVSENGIMVNTTTGGLDVFHDGRRTSLLGSTVVQIATVELSPGQVYEANSVETIPVKMTTAGSTATIKLSDAPAVGDKVSVYDQARMLDAETKLKFTNGTVNGRAGDFFFAEKGGLIELEYVGGTVGYRVESVETFVPEIIDVTSHIDETTLGTEIVEPGVYRVTVTSSTVCPVNHEKLSVGQRVYVVYEGTDPFRLIHGKAQAVLNAPSIRYCSSAMIAYLKTAAGLIVENAYYGDVRFSTMVEFDTYVNDNGIDALDDITMYNFDFANWSYLPDDWDGYFPQISPVKFSKWVKFEREPFHTDVIGDIVPNATRVDGLGMTVDKLGAMAYIQRRYDSARENVLSQITLDVGREITRVIEDTTARVLQRVSKATKIIFKADGANMSMDTTSKNFHIGDELILINHELVMGSDGVATLTFGDGTAGKDTFDALGDGTQLENQITLTGKGTAIIRKKSDYVWELVARS